MALATIAALRTYLAQPSAWAQSTAYVVGDQVRAVAALYVCITAGTSSGTGTGPSGTTADITDNTAHWKYLGPSLSTDDATLTRLLTAVGAFFAAYCDRTFSSGSQTYVTNGTGNATLLLPDYPVSAITSVTIDGTAIAARPSVGAAGYVLVAPNTLMLDGDMKFTRGIANVTVVYTAGYSTIPYDLEQACLETCASWYKRRMRTDEESKSIQGEVITFSTSPLPKAAKAVLDLYKRVWPR